LDPSNFDLQYKKIAGIRGYFLLWNS